MTEPFDDIRALFAQFPPTPEAPPLDPALGELASIAAWITRWRGEGRVSRPILCLYAGAHAGGDIAPIRARMEAIAAGDAAINRGLHHLGAGLDVFDLALERPVGDAHLAAAMSARECAATMAFGMEALAKQPDLLMLIGAGPGADEAGAAIARALSGTSPSDDADPAVARAVIEAAGDPLELLRQLGGRETAAVAGAILGARIQNVPVLLDGTPALAAAAVLHAVDPEATVHCRVAHAPHSPAGRALAARLGRGPLLGLQLGLEDGTAALAALSIVKLAGALATAPNR
jgi:nicotinate-nucleotide--dimethylbenzimidazole phosphoribosyltransferase